MKHFHLISEIHVWHIIPYSVFRSFNSARRCLYRVMLLTYYSLEIQIYEDMIFFNYGRQPRLAVLPGCPQPRCPRIYILNLDKLLLLLVTLGNVVSNFRRTKIQSKTDCQSFANKCKRTFHYYFTQVRLILVANQNQLLKDMLPVLAEGKSNIK